MRISAPAMLLAGIFLTMWGTGCASNQAAPVRTYRMGDRIQLGKLIYNVYDSQWHTQFGEGPGARVPQHRFFLVRFSVTNSGTKEVMAPAFSAAGSNGATYEELPDGSQVPQWAGYLRSVKPAETVQGNVIFDCPPANYKIRLSDENEQSAVLVDIPLTFGAETPEVPSPEIPQTPEKK